MLSAVILAAGDCVRMKAVKPLLLWKGLSFIEHVCAALRSVCVEDRVVVLGSKKDDILSAWMPQGEKIAINPNPAKGQLSSLRAGLQLINENSEGVLICLADQPTILSSSYKAVISAWQQNKDKLIIPRVPRPNRKTSEPPYKRGHPIIIPRSKIHLCFTGPLDKGLHWVTHHSEVSVEDIDVEDIGIIEDFDTPQAYEALIKNELRR